MGARKNTGDSQVSETGNELINAAGVNEGTAKSNENPGGDAGPAAGEPGAGSSIIPAQSEATETNQPGGAEITIDQNQPVNEPLTEQQPSAAGITSSDYQAPTGAAMLEIFAEAIAKEPDSVVEGIAKIAGEELQRRNPAPESVNLTEQQLNDLESLSLHEQRVKQYGENYVLAKNGERETIFTRTAWNNLGGTKDGWKEEVPTPPEVLALNK